MSFSPTDQRRALAHDPIVLGPVLVGQVEELDFKALSPAEQREGRILASREVFRVYARLMFEHINPGIPFSEKQLHQEIFHFLHQAYTVPGFAGIINIAPRSGKTELMCLWISWCFGKVPDSEFLYITYGTDLAEGSSIKIKDIINSDLYKQIFPETRIDRLVNAREKFHTTKGGKFLARGIEGTITGYGAGRFIDDEALQQLTGEIAEYSFRGALVMDDLIKPGEAASDIILATVKKQLSSTIWSRINDKGRTPVILIGQRVGLDDPTGMLLPDDARKRGMWPRKFVKLKIKSLVNGRSVWEARWPTTVLIAEQELTPWTFATQSQQEPYNESGNLFKVERMPILMSRPTGPWIACRAWDLAARKIKLGQTEPDYTATVLLVYYVDHRMYVIEDAMQFRDTPDKVREMVQGASWRDGHDIYIEIPQDPGQAGVDQLMTYKMMLDGYKVNTNGDSRPTGDKVRRADSFASHLNAGLVAVLAPYAEFVKNELQPFPNGRHDDFVDACSDAYRRLAIPDEDTLSRQRAVAAMQRLAQFSFAPGLERERVGTDTPVKEGYLDEEGEV